MTPIGYVTISERKRNANVRRPYTLAAYAARLEVLQDNEHRKTRRDTGEDERWERLSPQRELFKH